MRSIVFSSGKGGVGKTSIALNLGLLLAMRGKRVVVVDADLDMAAVAIMLGIEINPITLHNVLAGENNILDAVYDGPQKLYYVPSSLHEEKKEIDLTRLRLAVSKLELSYDYILVDAPPGLGSDVRAIITSARELVIVSTPDPTAVIDSLKVKKFAEKNGVNVLGVVLNRATGDKNELKPADLESILGVPVLTTLPEDIEVRRSASLQTPVVLRAPTTPFVRSLTLLAARLVGEPLRPPVPRVGLAQSIKNFFKKIFGKK